MQDDEKSFVASVGTVDMRYSGKEDVTVLVGRGDMAGPLKDIALKILEILRAETKPSN